MPHLGSTVHRGSARGRRPGPQTDTARRDRVTIISASVGAGHDGAATELARRLAAAGITVDRYDLLDLLPARLGRAVSGGYHRLLVHAPWAYQRIYTSTERAGGSGPAARALLRAAEDRVLRALPAGTGAVVSTYPGASRILGALRLAGRLDRARPHLPDRLLRAPAVGGAGRGRPPRRPRRARRPGPGPRGAADVRVRGPVTDPRFRPRRPRERAAARARFGLPARRPAGAAGRRLLGRRPGPAGGRRAARQRRGRAGRRLRPQPGAGRAAARDGIEHAYGWVDDMPGLMHAADVLVQNAGGLTSLEALAAGLPVAGYRCIPGHGLTNAAALERGGRRRLDTRPGRAEARPVRPDRRPARAAATRRRTRAVRRPPGRRPGGRDRPCLPRRTSRTRRRSSPRSPSYDRPRAAARGLGRHHRRGVRTCGRAPSAPGSPRPTTVPA